VIRALGGIVLLVAAMGGASSWAVIRARRG
jgi:hypothetical protein